MTTDSSLDLEILKYSDLPTQVLYIIVCKRIKLEVFKILENQMENFKFNIIIKMFSGFSHKGPFKTFRTYCYNSTILVPIHNLLQN